MLRVLSEVGRVGSSEPLLLPFSFVSSGASWPDNAWKHASSDTVQFVFAQLVARLDLVQHSNYFILSALPVHRQLGRLTQPNIRYLFDALRLPLFTTCVLTTSIRIFAEIIEPAGHVTAWRKQLDSGQRPRLSIFPA